MTTRVLATPATLVSLFAYLLASPCHGAADDFARGRLIETSSTGPLERLVLPRDVYEWSTAPDLGDLRVLDSAGAELPYTLRTPTRSEAPGAWQVLPLFALPARSADTSTGTSRIELASDGAIIAVHGGSGRAEQQASWLVDVAGFEAAPLELEFRLTEQDTDLLARIRIDASSDLERWQSVGEPSAIVRLAADTNALLRNRVTVPAPGGRYLRVTRLDTQDPLPLDAIAARTRDIRPPVAAFATLAGTAVNNGWEFDTGGRFPVDRVRVGLDQPRYLVTARVASRPDATQRWREHVTQRFHRVVVDGVVAAAEPVPVPVSDHRLWRVEWTDGTRAEPVLEIGWTQQELLFLKQGSPPYLLAYGRGGLEGRPWPMRELLRQLGNTPDPDLLTPALLAAPVLLGGPTRLAVPAPGRNWETLLLWAVLGLGAALILTLAVRLAR